jgi:uncharacterized protein YjiK
MNTMIHSITIKILFVAGASIVLHSACQTKTKEKAEPVSENIIQTDSLTYDFKHPDKKWVLSDSLMEISGIAWLGENKMMVVEDLRPLLYRLKLGDTAASITEKILFKETDKDKYDIEDLALVKDTIYALYSHGKIFKIWKMKKKWMVQEIKTDLDKENDTEGLAYDSVSGNLLIACKSESAVEGEKSSTRSIFAYEPLKYVLNKDPFLLIHPKDFKVEAGEKLDFYPSGIAIHPQSHDIFIMSTKENKCIAEYSRDGKLKAFSYFDKELLPQPEGICFDPQGNLYISTEGRHGKPAYIYEFMNKK